MRAGYLLIVSGPAGVGKGTICKELLDRDEDMIFSVSSTTRGPREGEVDGVNYNFIDEDRFKAMIDNDEFLEHAHVHTDYYGTPRKFVEEGIKDGNVVLLEIDVQGALQVKEKHPEVVTIFILPPSMDELKRRIVDRNTETDEQIEKRMKNAIKEIKLVDEYDYFIVNDDLDKAILDAQRIVEAEKSKVSRYDNLGDKFLNKEEF